MNELENKMFGRLVSENNIEFKEISEEERIIIINNNKLEFNDKAFFNSGYIDGDIPFLIYLTEPNIINIVMQDRVISMPYERDINNIFRGNVYINGEEKISYETGQSFRYESKDIFNNEKISFNTKIHSNEDSDKLANALLFGNASQLLSKIPNNGKFDNVRKLTTVGSRVITTNRNIENNGNSAEITYIWDNLDSLHNNEGPSIIACDISFYSDYQKGKRYGYFVKNDDGSYEAIRPEIEFPNSNFINDYNEFISYTKSLGLDINHSDEFKCTTANRLMEPRILNSIRTFIELHLFCTGRGIDINFVDAKINDVSVRTSGEKYENTMIK